MFEEMKESNRRDHREVQRRLDDFNKKIEDLYKFRWITLGVALAVGTLVFKAPDIFSSWGWTQTSQVEMQSKIS